MLQANTRIQPFRGANVPVRTDGHGNDVVSMWSRRATKEVMFCASHAAATLQKREGDDWVPITTVLPMQVTPRAGLEDGIVVTLDQLMDVFHEDSRVLC